MFFKQPSSHEIYIARKKKIYGDHVEYLFYFPLGWLRELIVKPDPCFQMDFAPSILVREKSIGDT